MNLNVPVTTGFLIHLNNSAAFHLREPWGTQVKNCEKTQMASAGNRNGEFKVIDNGTCAFFIQQKRIMQPIKYIGKGKVGP